MTRTLARILAILEHHRFPWPGGKPPADIRIRRTYAGREQRNAGAWSWSLWSDTYPKAADVGGQNSASELARLRPEDTEIGRNAHDQWTIDPARNVIASGNARRRP